MIAGITQNLKLSHSLHICKFKDEKSIVPYKTHRRLSDYTPYSFLLIILKTKPKLRGLHTVRVILSLPLPSLAGTPCYSLSKPNRY
jgi:hypothetical protein